MDDGPWQPATLAAAPSGGHLAAVVLELAGDDPGEHRLRYGRPTTPARRRPRAAPPAPGRRDRLAHDRGHRLPLTIRRHRVDARAAAPPRQRPRRSARVRATGTRGCGVGAGRGRRTALGGRRRADAEPGLEARAHRPVAHRSARSSQPMASSRNRSALGEAAPDAVRLAGGQRVGGALGPHRARRHTSFAATRGGPGRSHARRRGGRTGRCRDRGTRLTAASPKCRRSGPGNLLTLDIARLPRAGPQGAQPCANAYSR